MSKAVSGRGIDPVDAQIQPGADRQSETGKVVEFDSPSNLLQKSHEEGVFASMVHNTGSKSARYDITVFFTSPGFSDERVYLYLAEELAVVCDGAGVVLAGDGLGLVEPGVGDGDEADAGE